jgi:L-ascorbate metabolism protein UlaG (beta-lactamase superfamily)
MEMSENKQFGRDVFTTSQGDLTITFIGHGSLMLDFNQLNISVDPFSRLADYSQFPKADLVLITHEHMDHLDQSALDQIRTSATELVLTETCAEQLSGGVVMANGDQQSVRGIPIEAVAAYNLVHKRENGQPFHPRGVGNGYILTFGGVKVYIAGDTENTPEMKSLVGIDIAFLPMNLPYTMTPGMVADAARAFKPGILYPYHYGNTDPQELVNLLANEPGIEVRIRQMA